MAHAKLLLYPRLHRPYLQPRVNDSRLFSPISSTRHPIGCLLQHCLVYRKSLCLTLSNIELTPFSWLITSSILIVVNHIYNLSGVKENLLTLLTGKDKLIWLKSLSNEFGRLAKGNDSHVHGSDIINFNSPKDVPTDKMLANFFTKPLQGTRRLRRLVVGMATAQFRKFFFLKRSCIFLECVPLNLCI